MDELITRLVKKGQPLTHIYAEHESEMPVCLRTLYNYIDDGELTIKNIDLRRKPGIRDEEKVINHLLDLQIWSFVKAELTLILSMR